MLSSTALFVPAVHAPAFDKEGVSSGTANASGKAAPEVLSPRSSFKKLVLGKCTSLASAFNHMDVDHSGIVKISVGYVTSGMAGLLDYMHHAPCIPPRHSIHLETWSQRSLVLEFIYGGRFTVE